MDAETILRKIINGEGYVDLDAGIIDFSGFTTLHETLTSEEVDYLRTLVVPQTECEHAWFALSSNPNFTDEGCSHCGALRITEPPI